MQTCTTLYKQNKSGSKNTTDPPLVDCTTKVQLNCETGSVHWFIHPLKKKKAKSLRGRNPIFSLQSESRESSARWTVKVTPHPPSPRPPHDQQTLELLTLGSGLSWINTVSQHWLRFPTKIISGTRKVTFAHCPETSTRQAAKARSSLSAGLVLHPSLY